MCVSTTVRNLIELIKKKKKILRYLKSQPENVWYFFLDLLFKGYSAIRAIDALSPQESAGEIFD